MNLSCTVCVTKEVIPDCDAKIPKVSVKIYHPLFFGVLLDGGYGVNILSKIAMH